MSKESTRLLFDLFSLCSLRGEDDDPDIISSNHKYIDIISLLPREIAVIVLQLVTSKDLCRVQQVSKSWCTLCQHPQLQFRIEEYKLSCLLVKENSTSDRLCRRFSTGMINRDLDSPFASIQAASPTPDEIGVFPNGTRSCFTQALFFHFIVSYNSLCTRERLAVLQPQPVRLYTRQWPPTKGDSDSILPVGSKASKRRLKRF